MPLRANNQEARLGVLYYTATSNLKVDIGNDVDLVSFNFPGLKSRLTLGIEFMAYAFSTSYKNYRLQIDALDGFFGGNASYSQSFGKNKLQLRFRIIHNSAHNADGHYDMTTGKWINNTEPIPFTKDFGELTLAHNVNFNNVALRYYGGLLYATLVRPLELKKYNYFAGLELSYTNLFGKVFSKDENIFLANHFKLTGSSKYIGSQQTIAGIKLGDWNGKGISFYASYYSGSDVFSVYYYKRISKFGIGFNVDF